jgi:amino-acid N-acetyltransferase
MDTAPSKRELQQFLKRYVPQQQTPSSTDLGLGYDIDSKTISPKDYVSDLLAPSYTNQIALTKVQGPFAKGEWQAVGKTLFKLQKLGLTSIVVADNLSWGTEKAYASLKERGLMMVRESMALVEAIEKAGGRAQLIYGGLLEYNSSEGPLDVNMDFIHSALNNQQIPIIVPTASLAQHDRYQHHRLPEKQRSIDANDVMIALAQKLVSNKKSSLDTRLTTPSKIVVINSEGGIPNHEYSGNSAHSLINVQEEYDIIVDAFKNQPSWRTSHPSALSNLKMIRTCLAELPPTTSSAVIVPTPSLPSALIANLVTDKPLYSSSLPIDNKDNISAIQRVNQMRTTVLRHGIKIQNYSTLDDVDLPRLTALLEASFQKKLDVDGYYKRLGPILAGAIIAGDYEGAVLMTDESKNVATGPHQTPIHYLDKFAIAPTSQGIGLTDILWKRMCDTYPELLWRSRKDNGVNKW